VPAPALLTSPAVEATLANGWVARGSEAPVLSPAVVRAPWRRSGRRGSKPALPRVLLLGAIVLLSAAKLWLVAEDEIAARAAPHDQTRFAGMASHLIRGDWLGPYDHMTLIREPGYPLWIWLVNSLGVPLRLGTEILALAASAFFAIALRLGLGTPRLLAAAVFAFLAFLPHATYWNSEVRAETLYSPLLLLALGSCCLALAARRRGTAIAANAGFAVSIAAAWCTRPENALLAVLAGAFLLSHAVLLHRRGFGARAIAVRVALKAGAVALLVTLGTALVAWQNARAYGVGVITELNEPNFRAAYRSLLRADPAGAAPRRFVSVPRAARAAAYRHSAAFSELEPFLEGDVGRLWTSFSGIVGVDDDIADGWFLWALRDAVAAAGHAASARDARDFYGRISSELEASFASGALPSRSVAFDFVNPDVALYLGSLPGSLLRVADAMRTCPNAPDGDDRVDADTLALFDRIGLRRAHLTRPSSLHVSGWCFALEGGVTAVRARSAEGKILASSEALLPRPDVVRYFADRGIEAPVLCGFDFRLEGHDAEGESGAATLTADDASGTRVTMPVRDGMSIRPPVAYGVDVESDRSANGARRRAQESLRSAYPVAFDALAVSAGLALALVWFRRRARPRALPRPGDEEAAWGRMTAFALFVIAAVVAPRLLLFAWIDASSFPGNDSRYVTPVTGPFWSACLLLAGAGLSAAVSAVRSRGIRPRAATTSTAAAAPSAETITAT